MEVPGSDVSIFLKLACYAQTQFDWQGGTIASIMTRLRFVPSINKIIYLELWKAQVMPKLCLNGSVAGAGWDLLISFKLECQAQAQFGWGRGGPSYQVWLGSDLQILLKLLLRTCSDLSSSLKIACYAQTQFGWWGSPHASILARPKLVNSRKAANKKIFDLKLLGCTGSHLSISFRIAC